MTKTDPTEIFLKKYDNGDVIELVRLKKWRTAMYVVGELLVERDAAREELREVRAELVKAREILGTYGWTEAD